MSWIALHNAAYKGDVAEVERQLRAGVDVNRQDDGDGRTALHYAAEKGHHPVLRTLLQAGADVQATTNRWQQTALHLAACNGCTEVCQVLVEAGADLQAQDADGRTAEQDARDNVQHSTADFLQNTK